MNYFATKFVQLLATVMSLVNEPITQPQGNHSATVIFFHGSGKGLGLVCSFC